MALPLPVISPPPDAVSSGAPSDQALHVPPPDRCRGRLGARLRRGMPLPGPQVPDPAGRPRVGHADLQLLHRAAHLPPRRGLTDRSSRIRSVSARRSVSRVLSHRAPKRASGMAIHLWPPVTRRLLRPTRGLGSAPLPRTGCPARVAPSYSALLRVEFAAFHSAGRPESRSAASSLWHWSSSHDGRALPATLRWGARTFLTANAGSLRRCRATIRPPR